MKVVFLDFDGVLNTENSYSSTGDFSKAACENLHKFLNSMPGLKIVVSSSWRHKGLTKVKEILEKNGFAPKRVIDITDETERTDRGHHIERYVQDHKDIENFVILDDKADMDKILAHLVQINPVVGFTTKDAEKARKILKN